MSELETTSLTLSEAIKFLKLYDCDLENQNQSASELKKLRKALLMIVKEAEWENIGICADNLAQGLQALKSYLQAFGYQDDISLEQTQDLPESVYIKFNTQKMTYYVDSYRGNSRGVLVATQGYEESILGTYGYFPLDLFTAV